MRCDKDEGIPTCWFCHLQQGSASYSTLLGVRDVDLSQTSIAGNQEQIPRPLPTRVEQRLLGLIETRLHVDMVND